MLAVGVMAMGCNSGSISQTTAPLKTTDDSVAFYIGYMMGSQLEASGITNKNLDMNAYVAGFNTAIQGKEMKDDPQKIDMMLRTFSQKAYMEKSAAETKAGEDFLKENAKKAGVDTLAGGVQYKVIKAGEGAMPTEVDVVKVAYTGKLVNGKVFDTRMGEEAVEFPVNGVIPGWTTALKAMPVGSKWEVVIPSDMAYGPRGNGAIPGNSVLIFEMELLDIVKADSTSNN